MAGNVNVNIDKDMVERLDPFGSTSYNVIEDMMGFVGILRNGLAIPGFDEDDLTLFIGHGIGYLASRIGRYCINNLDDFLSIVKDEKLREGFKSALMFLNAEANSLAHKKTK